MFSKVRSLKVLAFVAILMLVSVVAVAAAVECYWQISPFTTASNSSPKINTGVTDTLVLYPEAGYPVRGTLNWYVCGPTTTIQNCSDPGGNNFYNKTNVSLSVSTNGVSKTVVSGIFTPTVTGVYCFRVKYTDTYYSTYNFTHVGGTTNTAECFNVGSATAVTLSSFGAQSDALDMSNLVIPGMSLVSLFALVGLLGAGYVVRARS